MSFKFKKASAVAVGTFNIYIVQPTWLIEAEIVARPANEIKVEFHSNLNRPGFRFSFESEPFVWFVHPDRVTVEVGEKESNCGEKLSQVLSALEWTPVVAVGANCEFSAELSDWDSISKRLSAIANPEDVEDFELQQQTWHFSVAKQGTVFNIQISQTRNAFELSLNAHTEIKGHGDTQRDRNSFAMNACNQFFENRTETITLAESILGVEVER